MTEFAKERLSLRIATAIGRTIGNVSVIVLAAGFMNWVEVRPPMVHEPLNLWVVAWVALLASWHVD